MCRGRIWGSETPTEGPVYMPDVPVSPHPPYLCAMADQTIRSLGLKVG